LLLDRAKIRRRAKWIALVLAIVFAVSFVGIGIGQGTGGFNVFEVFSGGCTEDQTADTTPVVDKNLQSLLDDLEADPADTDAMVGLARYYQSSFSAEDNTGYEDAQLAADYYEQAIETDPTLVDTYLELAKLYEQMFSYEDAVRVLNLATAIDPNNPDVFYYLGKYQNALGNTGEAILAWERYLQIAPEDDRLRSKVRNDLQAMTAPTTTTTAAPSTTTSTQAPTTTTVE